MKARNKIRWGRWIAGGIVFAAIMAGLFMYGKQATSESRLVLEFATALETENTVRIGQLVYPDRGTRPIGEKNAERLLTYLLENNLLESALRDLDYNATSRSRDASNNSRLFAVQQQDKWLGMFQRSRIVVSTSSVEVTTNLAGTVIKLDDDTVATADSDEFRTQIGVLVPGSYRLEAVFTGAYATLRAETDVTVNGGDQQTPVDLSLNGGMVRIAVHENTAIEATALIYLDGQQVGTDMGEGLEIGPLALDGSHAVHAEKILPWGVARSLSIPVENDTIRLHIDPNTDGLKEAAINAVTTFILSYMEAYSHLDPSMIKQLADERKAQLAAGIEDYRSFGLRYEAQPKELAFDLDSIYVQTDADNSYWVAVSVRNTYLQRHYADEEPLPAFEEVTETVTYRLALVGDDWIVKHWLEEPNFSKTNVKLVNF